MSSPTVGQWGATSPPVIMNPCETGFDVIWSVSGLCRGWVEVTAAGDGAPADNVRRFAHDGLGFVPQGDRFICVKVHSLPAGACCRVRAITEPMGDGATRQEGRWRSLRLPSADAETAHFVLWNDTHQNDDTLRQLDTATPRGVDFLVWNGDICAREWLDEASLLPTFLRPADTDFSLGRPLIFVPGNHDARGPWAFRLADILPKPGGKTYQALRVGPVACLFLNTGEDKADDHPSFHGRVAFDTLRREQADWMRAIVARPAFRNAPYRVVICHIPLRWTDEVTDFGYDYFSQRSRDYWHDTLVDWGAQLILSGHRHELTWLPPVAEFPYAQLVGGGPTMANATIVDVTADQARLLIRLRDVRGKPLRVFSIPALPPG